MSDDLTGAGGKKSKKRLDKLGFKPQITLRKMPHIKVYPNEITALDVGVLSDKAMYNINEYYLYTIGIGATFEKNVRLVELQNGEKVWLAEIVDNDFEEKVADWIFDEEGNTLLCYPDPKEFDRILIEIDRKHGLDEYGEPIKKEIKEVIA